MSDWTETGFSTRSVPAGKGVDEGGSATRRPIITANGYRLPYVPSALNWSDADALLYTRNAGANQLYLCC